jgi:hypothetical protein
MNELKRQLLDQFAHYVWGVAVGMALEPPFTPISCIGAGIWFGREQQQGRNDRVGAWDPMLDWTFFFLGNFTGAMLRRLV